MSRAFFDKHPALQHPCRGGSAETAGELIGAGGTISVQYLNEFVLVARRKLKMPWERITEARDTIISLCRVVPVSIAVHLLGATIAERYRLGVYDSMILAAAIEYECDTLYSEDMQHGLVVDGRVTILNPYRD